MNQKSFPRYSLENLTLQKQFGAMKWGEFSVGGTNSELHPMLKRSLTFLKKAENPWIPWFHYFLLPSARAVSSIVLCFTKSNRGGGVELAAGRAVFPWTADICLCHTEGPFVSRKLTVSVDSFILTELIYYQHLPRRDTFNITVQFLGSLKT